MNLHTSNYIGWISIIYRHLKQCSPSFLLAWLLVVNSCETNIARRTFFCYPMYCRIRKTKLQISWLLVKLIFFLWNTFYTSLGSMCAYKWKLWSFLHLQWYYKISGADQCLQELNQGNEPHKETKIILFSSPLTFFLLPKN